MQTKQEENLAALKKQLGRLVFVQVGKVVVRENDLLCFRNKSGSIAWDNDLSFRRDMDELKYADEWDKAEKSYHNYFGFGIGAQEPGVRNIYFNRKARSPIDLTRLNVLGKQDLMSLPAVNSWIVGILGMQSENSKGPWFQQWQCSTERVKLFTDYFLGREKMVLEDIIKLVPEINDGRDRLVAMATILVLRDMDFLLNIRRNGSNPTMTDCTTFDVCDMYDQAFWLEYKEKALEQRVYSELIHEPSPKKITEQLGRRPEDTVGLGTPFANLVLR